MENNNELKLLLLNLTEDLIENTAINKELLDLLKDNNNKTDKIHSYVEVELSTSQQLKDFGFNVLANIAGNAIATPTIINLK